jgi:hypothetical protein
VLAFLRTTGKPFRAYGSSATALFGMTLPTSLRV